MAATGPHGPAQNPAYRPTHHHPLAHKGFGRAGTRKPRLGTTTPIFGPFSRPAVPTFGPRQTGGVTPEEVRNRARIEVDELDPEPVDPHDRDLWVEERRAAAVLLAALADWSRSTCRHAALDGGDLAEPAVVSRLLAAAEEYTARRRPVRYFLKCALTGVPGSLATGRPPTSIGRMGWRRVIAGGAYGMEGVVAVMDGSFTRPVRYFSKCALGAGGSLLSWRDACTGWRAAIAGGTYAGEVLGSVMGEGYPGHRVRWDAATVRFMTQPRSTPPGRAAYEPPAVPTRLALVGALAPDAASSDAPPGDLYS